MSGQTSTPLRLGTRGSTLALAQSQLIVNQLQRFHPSLPVTLTTFKTSGDQIADRPLHELGGKGLFVRELEQALLDHKIDFVVHSFKDVPVTMPLVEQTNLIIAAVPEREDVRDVLISTKSKSIHDLFPNAKIGTGSLRRRCQLLALRPDLKIEPIRGNIDTRIRKLKSGEFDAIILALAGLNRAKLFDPSFMHPLGVENFLPDAGQGALAIQCRRDDPATQHLLHPLDHPPTRQCVEAERSLVAGLSGDCFSPIGTLAELVGGLIHLRAAVGRRGGELPILKGHSQALVSTPKTAVENLLKSLSDLNVQKHLHG
jgi:hydroxymethylbilane synthase